MTTSRRVVLVLLIGVVLLSAVGCRKTPSTGPAGRGTPAPDFSATDLNGKAVSLSDYEGKVLVINYFATWCPPCKAEIPDFLAAYQESKDRGLEFIGVNSGEDPQDVTQFVKEHGITYPVIAGDEEMATKFGAIRAIPVTVFIGRDGKVADRVEGMLTRPELDKILRPLLAAGPTGKGQAAATTSG